MQADEHFYTVVRYVERNGQRAGLVEHAEDWRWSSLWTRTSGSREQRAVLSDWPLAVPRRWREWVNQPQTEGELEALRRSLRRGRPFGSESWIRRTASALGLQSTLRSRGRPSSSTKRP